MKINNLNDETEILVTKYNMNMKKYFTGKAKVKLQIEDKSLKNNDKGFTLVELIVVLVILAILAAFTIPAMLGFVEDAKGKAAIAEAREVYAAAQAAGTEIGSRWSGTIKDGKEQFKKDAGQKISELVKGDIEFNNVVWEIDSGNLNKPKESNNIEVGVDYQKYYESTKDKFKYKESAKVWFDKDSSNSGQFVVKAVWYVDKTGNYRVIIMEDSEKGISTTVEKIK